MPVHPGGIAAGSYLPAHGALMDAQGVGSVGPGQPATFLFAVHGCPGYDPGQGWAAGLGREGHEQCRNDVQRQRQR